MNKLKGKMREQGKRYSDCAKYIGISTSTFCDKINAKDDKEFKRSEIVKLIEFLALTKEEANEIFFN